MSSKAGNKPDDLLRRMSLLSSDKRNLLRLFMGEQFVPSTMYR